MDIQIHILNIHYSCSWNLINALEWNDFDTCHRSCLLLEKTSYKNNEPSGEWDQHFNAVQTVNIGRYIISAIITTKMNTRIPNVDTMLNLKPQSTYPKVQSSRSGYFYFIHLENLTLLITIFSTIPPTTNNIWTFF